MLTKNISFAENENLVQNLTLKLIFFLLSVCTRLYKQSFALKFPHVFYVGLLQPATIMVQAKRFRKVNIQRPRPPHFERAVFNAATAPLYLRVPIVQECREEQLAKLNKKKEVKEPHPYIKILASEVIERFNSSAMILVCHVNSITEYEMFKIKVPLHQKGVSMKKYGPAITKLALKNTKFEKMLPLFRSNYCLLFSSEQNINDVLPVLRKTNKVFLIAGVVENRFLNRNQLIAFSQMPSLDVIRAQFAATLHLAGNSIVNKLQAHQSNLCSLLDIHAKALGEAKKDGDSSSDSAAAVEAKAVSPANDPPTENSK